MSEDEGSRKNQKELGYAEAIAVANTIYVSGVAASLRPGDTDYLSAYADAFERIAARLRRLGATWDDVVSMTSFHTVAAQVPELVAVKRRYVRAPHPPWTAVGVTRLLPNYWISKITVTAIWSGPTASGARPIE